MNKNQKIVLGIMVILLTLVLLFPENRLYYSGQSISLGRHFITYSDAGSLPNYTQMMIETIGIIVVGTGVILLFSKRRHK
jgi:hypothetical protein